MPRGDQQVPAPPRGAPFRGGHPGPRVSAAGTPVIASTPTPGGRVLTTRRLDAATDFR